VPQPSAPDAAKSLLKPTVGLGHPQKPHQGLNLEDRQNCKLLKGLVGERGFEPPTPWSRTRCSTRLSHSPTRHAKAFWLAGIAASLHLWRIKVYHPSRRASPDQLAAHQILTASLRVYFLAFHRIPTRHAGGNRKYAPRKYAGSTLCHGFIFKMRSGCYNRGLIKTIQ
jgi:hypothetical protein